jgi:hypothetical protein
MLADKDSSAATLAEGVASNCKRRQGVGGRIWGSGEVDERTMRPHLRLADQHRLHATEICPITSPKGDHSADAISEVKRLWVREALREAVSAYFREM